MPARGWRHRKAEVTFRSRPGRPVAGKVAEGRDACESRGVGARLSLVHWSAPRKSRLATSIAGTRRPSLCPPRHSAHLRRTRCARRLAGDRKLACRVRPGPMRECASPDPGLPSEMPCRNTDVRTAEAWRRTIRHGIRRRVSVAGLKSRPTSRGVAKRSAASRAGPVRRALRPEPPRSGGSVGSGDFGRGLPYPPGGVRGVRENREEALRPRRVRAQAGRAFDLPRTIT